MAYPDIIVPYFFIGKKKIIFYRQAFPLFCRTSTFSCFWRCKVINNRIISCLADDIEIFLFVNNACKILFCLPAVTQQNDIFYSRKGWHDVSYPIGCKFELGNVFLPHTVAERDGQINTFVLFPDRNTEHDAHQTVPVQISRAMMCSMVKPLGNLFQFLSEF